MVSSVTHDVGMRFLRVLALIVAVSVGLTGCAYNDDLPGREAGPVSESGVELPPTSGAFDYQLGEPYEVDGSLDAVALDSSQTPPEGVYGICYVNGFQTQPGESAEWLSKRGDLLLRDASGAPVVDPDWPDEYILDPSTSEQREGILAVLEPFIRGCAAAGFDAVEIDNLDTFTRFDGAAEVRGASIDESGALALAARYVEIAHHAGLAIGQKNAAELADRGREELGFDFAVAEECGAFDECAIYTAAYGPQVLQIEYTDNLPGGAEAVCSDPQRAPLTVIRDRDLVAAGAPGHFRQQC